MPVDAEGIVVDALPGDARAVLVTPAHQFPTGVVLSPARRAALLALGRRPRRDRSSRTTTTPSTATTARRSARSRGSGPTSSFHVGSVSKTLAPALRLGWLIAPEAWRERLLDARELLDHGLPALEQIALADFIERGAYDRHLRRSAPRLSAPPRRADRRARGRVAGRDGDRRVGRPARRRPHPGRRRRRARRRLPRARAGARRRRPPRWRPSTLLISFAAVPEAAAGHVAKLIASAL